MKVQSAIHRSIFADYRKKRCKRRNSERCSKGICEEAGMQYKRCTRYLDQEPKKLSRYNALSDMNGPVTHHAHKLALRQGIRHVPSLRLLQRKAAQSLYRS